MGDVNEPDGTDAAVLVGGVVAQIGGDISLHTGCRGRGKKRIPRPATYRDTRDCGVRISGTAYTPGGRRQSRSHRSHEVGEPLRSRHLADPAGAHTGGQWRQGHHVESRFLIGVCRPHGRQHPIPEGGRGDDFHPVLRQALQRSHGADRRGCARGGQELSAAGDGPTAVRVVADLAGTGGEDRRTHRIGRRPGHEDHPLVQGRAGECRFQDRFDGQAQRLGQCI